MNLQDKHALITGGGSGIGRCIALRLAEAGCRVAVAGRRLDKLQEVVQAHSKQPAILAYPCDVANRASVQALFAWAATEFGQIDILINAAGANIKNRTIAEMHPEQWDELMAANATGAYNCIYEVLPQMRTRRDGLIINISSVAGKRASRLGGVAYVASKFAMTGLATAVALEEGHHNIRVTSIYPGEVDTPILKNRPSPVTDEHRARILQPDDIAAAVLMIAELPPRAHVAELVMKPTWQEYA